MLVSHTLPVNLDPDREARVQQETLTLKPVSNKIRIVFLVILEGMGQISLIHIFLFPSSPWWFFRYSQIDRSVYLLALNLTSNINYSKGYYIQGWHIG